MVKKSRTVNIVVLGEEGRSAITTRYWNNRFIEKYDPTIEDCAQKRVVVDDYTYSVAVTDTSGTEQFKGMLELFMRNGNIFIIVYSITSRRSFDNIQQVYEQITNGITKNSICVLLGNKCDLEKQRQVSIQEGEELALLMNCLFSEVSAKTGENVKEIFENAIRAFHNVNPEVIEETIYNGKTCIIQ